ncbi:MAG: hypothetical protein US69_C0022G0014 [candidate division TM6 bacterium GW2011_GWF2_38_10]|nr:MAG: hypothetical protein US69_C0022G0014 [candidate division TM6 bacterium GW2011_GWF2_38_10]
MKRWQQAAAAEDLGTDIRYNSNAIVNLETTNNAAHEALAASIRYNSNALLAAAEDLGTDIRYNSNAIVILDTNVRHNSNALVYHTRNLSSMIEQTFRTNSNALLYNFRVNSNALLFGDRINSNTAAYNTRINSTAINRLTDRFNALFGAPEEDILTPDYHLVGDYWLDEDHQMNIDVDCQFDGRGHTIWFLRDMGNLLRIGDNATVTFTNVVLKDFDDAAIQLGENAQVIFGDGTVIELANSQRMRRDWTFAGDVRVQGFGNVLSLAGSLKGHSYCTIGILSPGTLTIDDVVLDGIQDNNLRCIGDNATLTVKNSDVLLSSDYTFTAGTLNIEQDVMIKGPYTFGYETDKQSTIAKHSMLFFDMGTCFSYAPSIADRDLIAMEDTTSKLFLNGCDVCSTATGLRLTGGSLILDHRNRFNAQGSSLSEAIAFGNGIDERLDLQIMPGATIDVVAGVLDYAIENEPD